MRKGIILLVFLLAACGGTAVESAAPKAETIVCTAVYRASVSQPIEREETVTFSDSDGEQSVVFADMVFHAAYSSGEADNERALRVWVTDTSASLSTSGGDTAVYQSHLYQLAPDSGPQNQFKGGHGFTGLGYSYHPDSQAELQFWCAAN